MKDINYFKDKKKKVHQNYLLTFEKDNEELFKKIENKIQETISSDKNICYIEPLYLWKDDANSIYEILENYGYNVTIDQYTNFDILSNKKNRYTITIYLDKKNLLSNLSNSVKNLHELNNKLEKTYNKVEEVVNKVIKYNAKK